MKYATELLFQNRNLHQQIFFNNKNWICNQGATKIFWESTIHIWVSIIKRKNANWNKYVKFHQLKDPWPIVWTKQSWTTLDLAATWPPFYTLVCYFFYSCLLCHLHNVANNYHSKKKKNSCLNVTCLFPVLTHAARGPRSMSLQAWWGSSSPIYNSRNLSQHLSASRPGSTTPNLRRLELLIQEDKLI